MRYAERERLKWIGEYVKMFGAINRAAICQQFEISVPQASHDLQTYMVHARRMKLPNITYNKSTKRYETSPPAGERT